MKKVYVYCQDSCGREGGSYCLSFRNPAHAALSALADSVKVWGHKDPSVQIEARVPMPEDGVVHYYTVHYHRQDTMTPVEVDAYLHDPTPWLEPPQGEECRELPDLESVVRQFLQGELGFSDLKAAVK